MTLVRTVVIVFPVHKLNITAAVFFTDKIYCELATFVVAERFPLVFGSIVFLQGVVYSLSI